MKALKIAQRSLTLKRKINFLLIFLFFSSSVVMTAQSKIQFDSDQGISIKSDLTSSDYSISMDIEEKFQTKDLSIYFESYNTEISTIVYDKNTKQIEINLEFRMKPEWKRADWNRYLNSLHIKAIKNQKI